MLTARWREGEGGPGRKFFAATPTGRAALLERTDDWLIYTGRATALLTSGSVTA